MSESRFPACLTIILKFEGGYVDHPKDPGGATNHGITRKTLAAWRGIALRQLPKSAVRALGDEETEAIYKSRYWDICRCGELPPGVDLVVFDGAVNSGPSRSVKWLQSSLGVGADGALGPKTLSAVKSANPRQLVAAILDHRKKFLKRLSGWKTFGRGWSARLSAVKKAAIAVAQHQGELKPELQDAVLSETKLEPPAKETTSWFHFYCKRLFPAFYQSKSKK